MTKSYIQITGKQISASIPKPQRRVFREAWQLEGDVITVNMSKARHIHREKLREERSAFFRTLDADFMKALESGETTLGITLQKQKLRDLPADIRLEEAETPEELELLTLDFLMNN
ncbi:hypothetical protein [Curvivirga aplysinae]|uniref:hypothetical protein n=1 Tax=Curvivirga aplysinae TaxID=2529852 RepID=UPI0012BD20AC|nr:hypothetical protein [Curvivirga aplysinae]MTI10274.1 hypothetical protein [Curvivirga aplysinae]